MRLQHIADFLTLRSLLSNHAELRRWLRAFDDTQELDLLFRDGRRLTLRGGCRDHHVFKRIFLQDTYRVNKLRQKLGCVLDLGANIGLFACCVAPRAERVVCYEPSPVNFDLLVRNTACISHVTVRQEAVAGEEGEAMLHLPVEARNRGAFSLFESGDAKACADDLAVPTLTLEAVMEREGIDRCGVVKMDIEGAEYAVLYATPGPVLARISTICGEYHSLPDGPPEANIDALATFLRDHGFIVTTEKSRRKPGQGRFFARR